MIPELRRDGQLRQEYTRPSGRSFSSGSQTLRREHLLTGLLQAMRLLKPAGCRAVYIDGSFVTTKPEPGDFDACWDITGIEAELVAPIFFDFANGRAAQKEQFGGEFFPAQLPEGDTGRNWLDFFQQDREGYPKGIVVLGLESIP